MEPEKPIEPYEFWHFWVHSGDRRSGTLADFEVDLQLPDLAMYEDPGAWNAAISWMSDPGVAAAVVIPQSGAFLRTSRCSRLRTGRGKR